MAVKIICVALAILLLVAIVGTEATNRLQSLKQTLGENVFTKVGPKFNDVLNNNNERTFGEDVSDTIVAFGQRLGRAASCVDGLKEDPPVKATLNNLRHVAASLNREVGLFKATPTDPAGKAFMCYAIGAAKAVSMPVHGKFTYDFIAHSHPTVSFARDQVRNDPLGGAVGDIGRANPNGQVEMVVNLASPPLVIYITRGDIFNPINVANNNLINIDAQNPAVAKHQNCVPGKFYGLDEEIAPNSVLNNLGQCPCNPAPCA